MKVRDENVIEHRGNLTPIVKRRMGIDPDEIAHIIKPLTDLYSDRELAPIREYSTNAWDSHIAAGNTRPIEIELPNDMRPVFIVRDFGIGLSMDEIVNRYGTYGASSKRDTDEAVGMLGFGCKSALTYTNQFTIIAVKGGMKTTVLVTKDEDGIGEIQVLDTCGTDAPNGVEISIPVVTPIAGFNRKAMDFYRFWEPGSVIVNGEQPPSFFDGENINNLFLDPDVLIVKTGLSRDYVVMGNVAYPTDLQVGLLGGAHIVARVHIGDVSFTPSRESLLMNKRTMQVCTDIKDFVHERLEMHIQRQIDAQPDRKSALREVLRWQGLVSSLRKQPTWRGETVPKALRIKGQRWTVNRASSYRAQAFSSDDIPIASLVQDGTYILRGHPPRSMYKDTKDAIVQGYSNARNVYIVWAVDANHKPWLDAATGVINWDDIKPAKMVNLGGNRGRPKNYKDGGGRWLVWQRGVVFETQDIPKDDESMLVWALKTDNGNAYHTREQMRRSLGEFCDEMTNKFNTPMKFVLLGTQDVERFAKLHPQAVHFNEVFQVLADQVMDEITDDQLWWSGRSDWRLQLDEDEVLDPEMVKLIKRMREAAAGTLLSGRLLEIESSCWDISRGGIRIKNVDVRRNLTLLTRVRQDTMTDLGTKMQEMDEEYVLAEGAPSVDLKTEYLNAIYLYRKGDCK